MTLTGYTANQEQQVANVERISDAANVDIWLQGFHFIFCNVFGHVRENGIPEKRGPSSGRRKPLSRYQATLAQPIMLACTGQGDSEGVPSYRHKRTVYGCSFQLKIHMCGGVAWNVKVTNVLYLDVLTLRARRGWLLREMPQNFTSPTQSRR